MGMEMLAARVAFLIAAALPPADPGAPGFTPDQFRGWFRAACDNELAIPRDVERAARRYRYVFVGGFANERMPGYFAQAVKELKAHGVPDRSIHLLFPSSERSCEGNGDEVRARFLEIADRGPEPLVVVGHSRGACDALAFALRDPAFVRDRIHALFLVQGAFGGTGAADYVLGEGIPMDRQMPARLRLLVFLLARFERHVLRRGKHGGLPGMTRDDSREFWAGMLQEHADALPIVGPKTFYVTSRIAPSRLHLFRKAVGSYLQAYYGANDGVVALRDQSLPGLGTCLGPFDAGHADLTHRFPATRAPRPLRRALVRSVLMAVGRPGPERAPGMLTIRQGRRAVPTGSTSAEIVPPRDAQAGGPELPPTRRLQRRAERRARRG